MPECPIFFSVIDFLLNPFKSKYRFLRLWLIKESLGYKTRRMMAIGKAESGTEAEQLPILVEVLL